MRCLRRVQPALAGRLALGAAVRPGDGLPRPARHLGPGARVRRPDRRHPQRRRRALPVPRPPRHDARAGDRRQPGHPHAAGRQRGDPRDRPPRRAGRGQGRGPRLHGRERPAFNRTVLDFLDRVSRLPPTGGGWRESGQGSHRRFELGGCPLDENENLVSTWGMAELDFAVFDADNHYYEAEDAFTRHMDRPLAKRGVQWAEMDGKQRLIVNGRICRFIPNPTFDPISKPGALDAYFRGRQPASDIRAAFGELDRMADHPEYRHRDARLEGHGRAGDGGLLPVPDARRRHGGGADRRSRGALRHVPGVQPVARRGLGLRVPRADLRRSDALARRRHRRRGRARRGDRCRRPHRLPAPGARSAPAPAAAHPAPRSTTGSGRWPRPPGSPSPTTRATAATAATPTTGDRAARWRRSASTRSARWSPVGARSSTPWLPS